MRSINIFSKNAKKMRLEDYFSKRDPSMALWLLWKLLQILLIYNNYILLFYDLYTPIYLICHAMLLLEKKKHTIISFIARSCAFLPLHLNLFNLTSLALESFVLLICGLAIVTMATGSLYCYLCNAAI